MAFLSTVRARVAPSVVMARVVAADVVARGQAAWGIAAPVLRRVPMIDVVTPSGWRVLFGSLAAWYAGARLGELVLVAATGLVTLLLCTAFVVGRMALSVAATPERDRVVAGRSTRCHVAVTNRARRRMLPIEVELPIGGRVPVTFDVPALAAGGMFAAAVDLLTDRRAVIPVGPATTVRGDPLGVLRRSVSWSEVREVFVHPVTTPLEPLGAGLLRDLEGYTTNDRPTPTRCVPTWCGITMSVGRVWRSSRRPAPRTSGQRNRWCRRRTCAPAIATPPPARLPNCRPTCGDSDCEPAATGRRRMDRGPLPP